MSRPFTAYGIVPPPNTLAFERHRRVISRDHLRQCPSQHTATRYFDQNGSDSTGNGSVTSPWKTLVKLQSFLTAWSAFGDVTCLLRGGQTWRENTQISIAAPNVTLGSWGGGKATITYFTLQYTSGWSAASGNAYSRSEARNPAAVRIAGPWSDNEIALEKVSSSGACGTTPQSWYYDGSANLFVNLTANWASTITISGAPTGGTFTLTVLFVNGPVLGDFGHGATQTITLPFNATAAQIQTALQATFNLQSLAAIGLLCSVTGSGPFVASIPAVGGIAVTVSASGAGLTGGTTPAVNVVTAQGSAVNPNSVSLEAVPSQSVQGIGIDNVDGCRVENLICMGMGVSNSNHVVGINANLQTPLGGDPQMCVFKGIEPYYTGYHGIGGTGLNPGDGITGSGGIVVIKGCRCGMLRDPDGGGSSHLTCYQTNGGHEFWVDGFEIIGGNIPTDSCGFGNASPIIAHTNSGNCALYWEKDVLVLPHPQAPRIWLTVGAIPLANGDPTQCRCFVVGRGVGSAKYPLFIYEGYQSHSFPDQWHANAALNIYIGAENTAGSIGLFGSWLANATINFTSEGGEVTIFVPSQNSLTAWLYNCLFMPQGPTNGVLVFLDPNASAFDCLTWGNYGNSGQFGMGVGTQSGCTYFGIWTVSYQNGSFGQVVSFATALDGIAAITNCLPIGTFPNPDDYFPGLAQYLVSPKTDATFLEYDRYFNDRTLQATRYVGPLVPGRDGAIELQEWEDATELMDDQGWGVPLANASLTGPQSFTLTNPVPSNLNLTIEPL